MIALGRALAWASLGLALGAGLVPARAQDRPDFAHWIEGVKQEARERGLHDAALGALDGIAPIDKVIELDRRQPEFTLSFQQYLAKVVNARRVEEGKQLLAENRPLLGAVASRYGVPAKYIVTLWGVETDFGKVTGGFPVVAALASLAYDGRRAAYFRTELFNALEMIDRGAKPERMIGSWAGAMGQCQFMPSTYLHYAKSWDGAGPPDIWTRPADVFASTANYLAGIGWKTDEGWGRRVRLSAHLDPSLFGLDQHKTVDEWSALGVRAADGKPLPKSAMRASLVRADSAKGAGDGPPYLVYDNFRALMTWNRSVFFAVAAGTLADRLATR